MCSRVAAKNLTDGDKHDDQTLSQDCSGAGRGGRFCSRAGSGSRHRLRQGGRAGQAGGRLSALLHRVLDRRGDARQEVLRKISAQGFDRRVSDRPARRDHRQQHAGRQAAHRLHGRHAVHRLDHQDRSCGHPPGVRRRHGQGHVQHLPGAQGCAGLRLATGGDEVARWQTGRHRQGRLF